MNLLHPAHFGISEACVAFAAVVAIVRVTTVWPQRALLVVAGIAPFGAAGLVGAVRIAGGMDGTIVDIHQALSRIGTLAGLACLVGLLAGKPTWQCLTLAAMLAGLAVIMPSAGVPLFAALLLVGTVHAYRAVKSAPLAAAGAFALLAIAQMLNALLRPVDPAVAWHLFHSLVAIWLLLVGWILTQGLAQAESR